MATKLGVDADRDFRRGRRELARHRPDRALAPLRSAVADCPAEEKKDLALRLYWLSMALLQLGRAELALKSLASVRKLQPRGFLRRAYECRTNGYGMLRRATPELDDFYAFYSIQACRYLGGRPGGRFAAVTEKDLVTRLIAADWLEIKKSGSLEGETIAGRLGLFNRRRIAYPTPLDLSARGGREGRTVAASACEEPLVVDFRLGRAVQAEDRCPCGSGLPYCRCCGRTQSPLERLR